MKPILALALLLALCLAALPCQAQKIAFVNAREVVVKCDEGAKAIEDIKQMFAPRQQSLAAMRQEIEALRQQDKSAGLEKGLEKGLAKGPEKNPEKNQKKTGDLEGKVRRYAQEEAQFRKDLAAQEETRLKPVAEKVSAAIKAYGAERNLAGVQDRGLFLYYDPALDVTGEIIKRVNQNK